MRGQLVTCNGCEGVMEVPRVDRSPPIVESPKEEPQGPVAEPPKEEVMEMDHATYEARVRRFTRYVGGRSLLVCFDILAVFLAFFAFVSQSLGAFVGAFSVFVLTRVLRVLFDISDTLLDIGRRLK